MNRANAGLLGVVVLLLGALWPNAASAQSEAQKRQAKEHYEKATRLYELAKYGEAIAEYEQSYMLIGDAALLFNIGQAYRLWDRPEEAIRAYKNYLRQRPDAPNRADVEKKIADLEKVQEEHRRGGAQPPPEAVPPVGPPTVPLPPEMPPAGYPPPGAPPPTVPPTLPPAGGAAEPPVAGVAGQPGLTAAPASSNWLAYTLLGVGGAGVVTMGIAAAVGASKANQVRDAAKNGKAFDPSVESSGKAANTIAYVGAAVGVLAGGTAVYLLLRQPKAAETQVSFVPALAPSFAGGTALVTF
jgi:tetratricopeptide (TPR) repeat protein